MVGPEFGASLWLDLNLVYLYGCHGAGGRGETDYLA